MSGKDYGGDGMRDGAQVKRRSEITETLRLPLKLNGISLISSARKVKLPKYKFLLHEGINAR